MSDKSKKRSVRTDTPSNSGTKTGRNYPPVNVTPPMPPVKNPSKKPAKDK